MGYFKAIQSTKMSRQKNFKVGIFFGRFSSFMALIHYCKFEKPLFKAHTVLLRWKLFLKKKRSFVHPMVCISESTKSDETIWRIQDCTLQCISRNRLYGNVQTSASSAQSLIYYLLRIDPHYCIYQWSQLCWPCVGISIY